MSPVVVPVPQPFPAIAGAPGIWFGLAQIGFVVWLLVTYGGESRSARFERIAARCLGAWLVLSFLITLWLLWMVGK